MGFIGWLTLLLIGIKLVGLATFSWWFVLAPLFVGLLIIVLLPLLLVMFGGFIMAIAALWASLICWWLDRSSRGGK